MASILDIVNSIIIAGIIALLVFGVHLMTMKSGVENRAAQQMQGLADGAVTILQEEIRFLHSFVSDSLKVSSNTLYFRNTAGQIVFMEAFNDSLEISKLSIGSQTYTDAVNSIPSANSVILSGSPSVAQGSLIRLTSELGEGQWRIVESYNSGLKKVTIRGEWDMVPDVMPDYDIYNSSLISSQIYKLRLLDKSYQNVYAFNLIKLNPDGSVMNVGNTIDAKDVDMIRVNISIQSQPEQFYQDSIGDYVIDLQKDFFLRGFRLPSAGG